MKSQRALVTVTLHIATERNTRVYLPEMWPPNSPDLDPVDYSVCGILQERVYRSWIHDVKELKEHLLMEWRLLDQSVIAAAIAYCGVAQSIV